jgi:formylmethanofuran dehydrogenase subunit B
MKNKFKIGKIALEGTIPTSETKNVEFGFGIDGIEVEFEGTIEEARLFFVEANKAKVQLTSEVMDLYKNKLPEMVQAIDAVINGTTPTQEQKVAYTPNESVSEASDSVPAAKDNTVTVTIDGSNRKGGLRI